MYFYEGMTCPVCQLPFHEDEDVVSCPQCGLPHHRVCWNKEGRCHLEHLHGTDQQWSRTQSQEAAPQTAPDTDQRSSGTCERCGANNPEFAEFCKRCGHQLRQDEWQSTGTGEYTPFTSFSNPYSSYSDSDKIGDVSAADYAAIVGQRPDYYIPRFRRIAAGNDSGGWNWSAFILTPYWLLYRKMFTSGFLMLCLQLINSTLTSLLCYKYAISNYNQLAELITQTLSSPGSDRLKTILVLSMTALSAIIFALSIFFGIAGNRLYRNHCTKVIHSARSKVPDITAPELATNGGVSFGVALLGYFVFSFLSQAVAIFFM